MTNSNCSHFFYAIPSLDGKIMIQCCFCKSSHEPSKGKSEQVIEMGKATLDKKLRKIYQQIKVNPYDAYDLIADIPILVSQINTLNQWLDPNSKPLNPIPLIDLVSQENLDNDLSSGNDTELSPLTQETLDNDLLSHLSPQKSGPKKNRSKGEGSGEIFYRKSKPKGREYEQMYFRARKYHQGDRIWRKAFYVPQRLESWVKQAQADRVPVRDIIRHLQQFLKQGFKPPLRAYMNNFWRCLLRKLHPSLISPFYNRYCGE